MLKFRFFYFVLAAFIFSCSAPEEVKDEISENNEEQNTWVKNPPIWSKNANIYEVNVRQYTPEGTFRAFLPHLDRLKELGVDILWFMPIHPIGEVNRKGGLGSYYSVKDYKGINPEHGNLDDFKSVVNKAHALNMKVIIDWVPNHTAWDNPFTSNPEWYELDSDGNFTPPRGTDWTDVIQLDYSNTEMRHAMIDAMKYWLTECNIDGFRCDVASKVPVDFWIDCRKQLDEVKDIFFLAEADEPWCHEAFDMTYGWSIHSVMNRVAKGESKLSDLIDELNRDIERYQFKDYRMHFTSNHDENSWNGTVTERMGRGGNAFFVLATTIPGMPLIYSGQEAGLNHRLKFFEKDEIDWNDLSSSEFFNDMLALKHEHSAIWNGEFGGSFALHESDNDHVIFFSRNSENDNVHVIINLSARAQEMSNENLEINKWNQEFLEGATIKISNEGTSVALEPWGYAILSS